jgi:hypothetical protein
MNRSGKNREPAHYLVRILALFLCAGANLSVAAEFRGLWVDAFGPGSFNANEVKKLARLNYFTIHGLTLLTQRCQW